MFANIWFGNIARIKLHVTAVRKNYPTLVAQNYMLTVKNPFTTYKIVRLNERTRSTYAQQTLAYYIIAFLAFDQTSDDHWETCSWLAESMSAF